MASRLHARVWRSISSIDGADEGSSIFSDDDAEPGPPAGAALARRKRFH